MFKLHFVAILLCDQVLSIQLSKEQSEQSRKPSKIFVDTYTEDDYIEDIIHEDHDLNVQKNISNFSTTFSNVSASSAQGDIRGMQPTGWCRRSKYIVPSPEDKLQGIKSCPDAHQLHERGEHGLPCKYVDLYGRYIFGGGNRSFYFVEIPKTASSTIKTMINSYCQNGPTEKVGSGSGCGEPRGALKLNTIKTFTFLRHPIIRFLSGYGTVIHREKEWHDEKLLKILAMPEPTRFKTFVSLYVKSGPKLLANRGVVFTHLMSQTFFMNLWPGKIHYVGHTENFHWSINRLASFLGLELETPPHLTHDEGGLNRSLLFECTESLQQLHDYFREEIFKYGYTPLPGYH